MRFFLRGELLEGGDGFEAELAQTRIARARPLVIPLRLATVEAREVPDPRVRIARTNQASRQLVVIWGGRRG